MTPTAPYPLRRLRPDQAEAVRRARAAGVAARDLAGYYGVTVRTIYRTLERAPQAVHEVRLADYQATFEITDEGPVQVTAWVPA